MNLNEPPVEVAPVAKRPCFNTKVAKDDLGSEVREPKGNWWEYSFDPGVRLARGDRVRLADGMARFPSEPPKGAVCQVVAVREDGEGRWYSVVEDVPPLFVGEDGNPIDCPL